MIAATKKTGKGKKKGKKAKKGPKGSGDAASMLSAQAKESISKGGVHFWITENGGNLSVGER